MKLSTCILLPGLSLCLALISACSDTSNAQTTQNTCHQPRPQACTTQYSPVCAILRDDSRKTFANRCAACSNPEVIATSPGACPGAKL